MEEVQEEHTTREIVIHPMGLLGLVALPLVRPASSLVPDDAYVCLRDFTK